VGARASDKFFRAYEKGFEMIASMPASRGVEITKIDGFPVEGIYRCEVELKSESRPITWDVVERRDQYFAGAYPFCADVLPGVEADILQRRPERQAQRSLEIALANCRKQFGSTLFTALAAYHGDFLAVWDRVVGERHSEPLLAAGVLLVDHD
jgi:DNA relaxase NicK